MKSLVIQYKDYIGFCCEEFESFLLLDVLLSLKEKYSLVGDIKYSESYSYCSLKESNSDKYLIMLLDDDGSKLVV